MANDIFAKHHRALDPVERAVIDRIKDLAEKLYGEIDAASASRESSIAKTKLEECVMWAAKGVALCPRVSTCGPRDVVAADVGARQLPESLNVFVRGAE